MDPLSLRARRTIASIFFVLFLAVLVVVSIYASGYRLGEELTLVRTGGIHISVPVDGATVTVDGKPAGTSGFLSRTFFIDNLSSGGHEVSVTSPHYVPWEKTLIVEHALVTDTNAFMVPEKVALVPVVIATSTASAATTTRVVTRVEYRALEELFEPPQIATTSPQESSVEPPQIEVVLRDGNVFVKWNRALDRAPSAFCLTPGACVVEISVEYGQEIATRAELFGSGLLYETENGGIYFAEVDVKQPQIVLKLYESPGAEFRILNGEIFIKDGNTFLVVSEL